MNVFDLNDLSDLPEDFKTDGSNRRQRQLGKTSTRILSLFDIQPQLTTAEIRVGLARTSQQYEPKARIAAAVYNLKKRGYVGFVEGQPGKYERVS